MNNNNTLIRRAILEDAEELTKLNIKCWQDAYIDMMDEMLLNKLHEIITIDNYELLLSKTDHNIHIAVLDNEIVGFVIYGQPHDNSVENQIEIYALYVDKNFYNKGIGFGLLAYVENNLQSINCDVSIIIWTLLANKKAQDFYFRQNFTKTNNSKYFTINEFSYPEVQFIKKVVTNE